VLNTRRVLLGTLAVAGQAVLLHPASASPVAASLCSPGQRPSAYPASESLTAAALQVEQRLGAARTADPAGQGAALAGTEALLDVAATASAEPDGQSLARYCAAAGELMRLSPDGSQRQAKDYLLTAVREAQDARAPRLAAESAYRLALVSVTGTAGPGVRGATRARRSGSTIATALRSAESADSANSVCSALSGTSPDGTLNSLMSMLALDCAARIAEEGGQHDLAALASLRFGRFALSWGDYSESPEELARLGRERVLSAIAKASLVADPGLRSELLSRLAQTALELGAGSNGELESARAALAVSPDPRAAGLLAELDSRLALRRGDRAAALAAAERAILAESARPLPVRLPRLYLLLGEIDPAARQSHVGNAYAALENLRPRLPRLDPLTEESVFALYMRDVFEAAADVQLAGADRGEEGIRIARAQQIVEAFREAELQSAVGSECLALRSAMDASTLAAGEIVLYPLLFPDRIELIYAVGGNPGEGSRFHRLAPSRESNRREIARLADALSGGLVRGDDTWKPAARRLYDLLIAPVRKMVGEDATLTVIPDGPLRAVPFAALIAPDGRYIVEEMAVSVAPALAYSQPGAGATDGQRSIVAASLEREVSLPAGIFPALSGTSAEAKLAAANGAPGEFVPDFTRAQLVTALSKREIDVLHLATHASFNGRSDRAFVVANGELIRLSELRDIIARDRVRGDTLDLLVLSACETAVGDDEGSMGLAGAAVQAGALSALASLWQVDDAGTARLMENFYRNYRLGRTRAQSLRDAQRAMIAAGGDAADPYVWAAFTLIGAWR
jgi:CHAT domain-containing protein